MADVLEKEIDRTIFDSSICNALLNNQCFPNKFQGLHSLSEVL